MIIRQITILFCFNSMKVRLKHGSICNLVDLDTFQFHEGPIKTDTFLGVVPTSQLFQFHEGPIKTMANQQNQWNLDQVSIP